MSTADDRSADAMAEIGAVLRRLREAAGLSLAGLATAIQVHRTLIGHIELGKRRLHPDIAERCDRALGTAPLLQSLVRGREGDSEMKRRSMLWMLSAAAGVTAASGRTALDEVLRRGLHDAVERPDDWEPVVADFQRRLVLDPSEAFGTSLAAQLLLTRQALVDGRNTETVRAAAALSLMYGLWLGNSGKLSSAMNWYRTSAVLAHESGDPHARTYTLGRSASRGIYEGMSRQQVTDNAARALAVTEQPTEGLLEAHSAMVGIAAFTHDISSGRQGVTEMRKLADQLPDGGPTGSYPRTANFNIFLEARAGTFASAEKAREEAEHALVQTPLWLAESRIYFALAMARDGDVSGAARFALDAIQTVPFSVHTLAMAVSDVLTAVPRNDRADEILELRKYALPVPGPWEAL